MPGGIPPGWLCAGACGRALWPASRDAAWLRAGAARRGRVWRASSRFLARISTYAAARKHDLEGHVFLACGFARLLSGDVAREPRTVSKGGKIFNLWCHKLKFLPVCGRKTATRQHVGDTQRKVVASTSARAHWGCGAGCGRRRLRRVRHWFGRGLATCGKAAVRGRWTCVPIDPSGCDLSTSGFALRNLHERLCRAGRDSTAVRGRRAGRDHLDLRRLEPGFMRLASCRELVRLAGACRWRVGSAAAGW